MNMLFNIKYLTCLFQIIFRYQVGELIYGSHVTNAYDQLALNSLVDYWLASSSVKKEFELPRGDVFLDWLVIFYHFDCRIAGPV